MKHLLNKLSTYRKSDLSFLFSVFRKLNLRMIMLSVILLRLFEMGYAQQTLYYTNPDVLFNQGKELYNERKYAASYRSFEDFLKNADIVDAGRIQEVSYYLAANAYELRQANASALLKSYLTIYPYTPFFDRTNFMLGMIEYEKKNFVTALTYFNQLKDNRLNNREQVDFLFCKGYACLETKNFQQALGIFKTLTAMNTRYNVSASYYYAYSNYCLGNYTEALPEFLKIENVPEYKNIVPYYIIQIFYIQKQYDTLTRRGDNLIITNPDNKNNAEIYRILGEIAYRNHNYSKAISYLKNYERMFPQVLRNDMYLLGLSYYKMNDYSQAVQYLSKVVINSDEMTENAYLHMGNAYVKLNDKSNAKLAYEAALRTNFNPSVREEALYNYALTTYETTTAFGESIKAFEQLLSEFPDTRYKDKAYDYLTSVYLTTKNYEAAYESIQHVLKPNAKLLETKQYLLYQLGTESFIQRNYDKAIHYFSLALKILPDGKYSAESLYWRSESYYRMNRPDLSRTDLKSFFDNPYAKNSLNRVKAEYALAYAYFSEKNYENAKSWFLKYLADEQNHEASTYADALNRVGDCYFTFRDFSQAINYYDNASSQSPNTADYAIFQSAYVSGLLKKYNEKVLKLQNLIKLYPRSEYADNAMYEMGRSYLMMNDDAKAISTYQKLLKSYSTGDQARKAALEIGMIYYNDKKYQQAIAAYKNVISTFPGSEESYTALQSLEAVYIEINDVASYLAYTKTLGKSISSITASKEDSISYVAAERQYMAAHYQQSIEGMQNYLNKYCPGSRFCVLAQYYLADSYYQIKDTTNALIQFKRLLKLGDTEYTEEAVMHCAQITYDNKDYTSALGYFKQLQNIAQGVENKNAARLGVLRCSYFLKDNETTVNIANEILNDSKSSTELKAEARFNRAKAYLALGKNALALPDFQLLAADTRTANGAEAKFQLANLYFEQAKFSDAENEVLDFAKMNTPYQYWLARSFVLLADIYIQRGDNFQAKQYLLSLQKNYTVNDDIQTMISDRLNAISKIENSKIIN